MARKPSLKLTKFTPASPADAIAATEARKSGKLLMVPVQNLTVLPGFNVRLTDTPEYEAAVEDLKQSIMLEGFYESKPLSCMAAVVEGENSIVVIDGHLRYAAVLAAIEEGYEIEYLPVVLKTKNNSSDVDLAVAVQKENASVPLSMLERAVLAERMIKSGMTVEEVAERFSKTTRHIDDLRVLIEAPKEVRELVKEGRVSASQAVASIRRDPDGAAEKLLQADARAQERALLRGERKAEKLTKAVVDGEGVRPPRMEIVPFNFAVKAGEEFYYEDVAPYVPLLGEDWFRGARSVKKRIAVRAVSIEGKVRREKVAGADAEEAEEPVARKRGRKAKAVEGQLPVEEYYDPALEDNGEEPAADDLDNAPDLEGLGIAEPADARL